MATWKKVIADGSSLTDIGTPASDDKVLIQDTSDSNIVKYVDFGDIGGGGGGGTTSTTPTIATISDFESSSVGTITISNYDSSADYRIILYNSSDTVVSHTITDNSDGTFSIAAGLTVGTDYYVTAEAAGFGELKSAVATSNTFDSQAAQTQMRYWRIQGTNSSKVNSSSKLSIADIKFFTGSNQTGTAYPTTDATSNTSISGITISAGHRYSSTYAEWRAFDQHRSSSGTSSSGMWWTLGNSVADNNWIQIDFGTSINLLSLRVETNSSYTDTDYAVLYGSNTGSFSGEEREMAFLSGIDSGAASTWVVHNFNIT